MLTLQIFTLPHEAIKRRRPTFGKNLHPLKIQLWKEKNLTSSNFMLSWGEEYVSLYFNEGTRSFGNTYIYVQTSVFYKL